MNNSIDIMNKMVINYHGKNISLISEKKSKEQSFDNNAFEYQDSSDIKQLYDNFIKNDNNNNNKSSNQYSKLIYTTFVAEQCAFYDDMLFFIENYLKNNNIPLDSDYRNLFSLACKNYTKSYREAVIKIDAYINKEKRKANSQYLSYLIEYNTIVEKKLYEKCKGIVNFINNNTHNNNYDDEGKTIFYKMMGDYNKYVCEAQTFKTKNNIDEVNKYYNESLTISNNLPIYSPNKLGLLLNMTVFYWDILGEKKKAIELAKSTIKNFEKEEKHLNRDDDKIKDCFSILKLLKENLSMWEKLKIRNNEKNKYYLILFKQYDNS